MQALFKSNFTLVLTNDLSLVKICENLMYPLKIISLIYTV